MDQLIRIREVCRLTGLTRPTLYRLIRRGELDPPIKISERCSAWRVTAVQDFIERRIAAAGRDPDSVSRPESSVTAARATG